MSFFSKILGKAGKRPTAADAGGYTQVQSQFFRFRLPGEWAQGDSSEDGQWLYERSDGDLSMSVLLFNQLAEDFKLEQYMRIRFEAEQRAAPGCELSAPVYSESGKTQTAEYGGEGPWQGRRVASVVRFDGHCLVQLYLGGSAPAPEFDRARELAFQSLEVLR